MSTRQDYQLMTKLNRDLSAARERIAELETENEALRQALSEAREES